MKIILEKGRFYKIIKGKKVQITLPAFTGLARQTFAATGVFHHKKQRRGK